MALEIRFCPVNKDFTLLNENEFGKTISPLPPRFSPEDAYGHYRREVKYSERVKNNLL